MEEMPIHVHVWKSERTAMGGPLENAQRSIEVVSWPSNNSYIHKRVQQLPIWHP